MRFRILGRALSVFAARVIVPTGVALLALPTATLAQEYFPTPAIGLRAGYDMKEKAGAVGGAFSSPIGGRVEVGVNADVDLVTGGRFMQLNIDVLARLSPLGSVFGGVGASRSIHQVTAAGAAAGNTGDDGISLFVGYEGGRGVEALVRPFIEARYTAIPDRPITRITVGINFPLERSY